MIRNRSLLRPVLDQVPPTPSHPAEFGPLDLWIYSIASSLAAVKTVTTNCSPPVLFMCPTSPTCKEGEGTHSGVASSAEDQELRGQLIHFLYPHQANAHTWVKQIRAFIFTLTETPAWSEKCHLYQHLLKLIKYLLSGFRISKDIKFYF